MLQAEMIELIVSGEHNRTSNITGLYVNAVKLDKRQKWQVSVNALDPSFKRYVIECVHIGQNCSHVPVGICE